MPAGFSKHIPSVVECLARHYDGFNPISLNRVRDCLGALRKGGVTEAYNGAKYGVRLGYIEAVPYGKFMRYRPTLTGVVKAAIMDAAMTALGIVDERVIGITERLSIVLYSNLLAELPDAILIAQHGARGIECVCCSEDGGCFGYKRIEGKDRVYLGMIALKVLAGVEVRGIRPRDYWQLFRFVRDEALFYLRRGFKGYDPELAARASPLMALFLLKLDRNWFVPRYKIAQQALGH
ncbi:MAG: hypothetical protein RXN91_04115 [Caldivirga sp.]